MNATYNFTSHETYLAARATWKANYKRITEEARKLRVEFNEAQRIFSKTTHGPDYWKAYREVEAIRSARDNIRREATNEINELYLMKEEAARQWRLEHVTHPRVLEHDYPSTCDYLSQPE